VTHILEVLGVWEDIEKPWQIAFEQGWVSLLKGSIPIGSVIADENMNIISIGRNRLYELGVKNPKIAHAETEAIQNLDISEFPDVKAYTLYACMEPCPMCMGTIVMSNLRKL
jgi:tRNA(Arg) A34 adenosine deaminase TadA